MPGPSVVLLESDRESALATAFREAGVEVSAVSGPSEAWDILRTKTVAVLVAPDGALGDAVDVVRRAARLRAGLVTVLVGSDLAGERARSVLRAGAFEALQALPDAGASAGLVERCLAQSRIQAELAALRDALQRRNGYRRLVGRSAVMERVRERVARLAAVTDAVIFVGEPGSGREVAARALHEGSDRADGPFVTVDVGGRSPELLDRAIFGRAGASPGALEEAAGGAIYLDDVASLPWDAQIRLARAIDEGVYERSGAGEPVPLKARVLAGAVADLLRGASAGRIAEELAAAFPSAVVLPPLRERSEDVALLTRHFVEAIREINDLPPIAIDAAALEALASYDWPGNVRELQNAVEHAIIVAEPGRLRLEDLPEKVRRATAARAPAVPSASARFREAKRFVVDAFEASYLSDLMATHRGNVTAAASESGMLRSALQRLLRKHGIRSSEFRAARSSVAPHPRE